MNYEALEWIRENEGLKGKEEFKQIFSLEEWRKLVCGREVMEVQGKVFLTGRGNAHLERSKGRNEQNVSRGTIIVGKLQ